MHVDEVFVEVRGHRCCVTHTVYSQTGYCPEAVLSEKRDLKDYDRFFAHPEKRLGDQIRRVFERERKKPPEKRKLVTFVSDKWGAIKRAFNRYFYRRAKLVHGVPIACKRFGLRFNNNPIEHRNGGLKQRYKAMRHFKSFGSAEVFVRLYRAIVNFVRHGTKQSPAHRAGVWSGFGQGQASESDLHCSALLAGCNADCPPFQLRVSHKELFCRRTGFLMYRYLECLFTAVVR
ncbi:MAG: hypothetical protein APU95_01815 [Hadesarchaea archaeon YNP_N21]|jgi:transposase-like protein|nr:MAG: hypothetical protein APU95_01815 [Hadesarchaea archaeon YNP_N21]